MTAPARRPEDDALDRLRDGRYWNSTQRAQDIATVREALERLRSQVKFCPYCAGAFVPESPSYEGPCEGCKIAERLREELDEYAERLAWHREERDAYLKGNLWVTRAAEEQSRAEAAEAEVRRLTEGLREIAKGLGRRSWMIEKARALLSASPPDDGGGGAK